MKFRFIQNTSKSIRISKTSDFRQKYISDSFKTYQNLSEKYTIDPVGIIVLFWEYWVIFNNFYL